nr:MAG TPA: hypothetical protein [Inoviridae sp.]
MFFFYLHVGISQAVATFIHAIASPPRPPVPARAKPSPFPNRPEKALDAYRLPLRREPVGCSCNTPHHLKFPLDNPFILW